MPSELISARTLTLSGKRFTITPRNICRAKYSPLYASFIKCYSLITQNQIALGFTTEVLSISIIYRSGSCVYEAHYAACSLEDCGYCGHCD
ncbi:hypothetical protein BDV40DRAFT_275340 [Aspergillus tamarii]|uniref:Uncharacterized protein n=1 Tax=Aspergillus tamarii TaxID=41984 RepID=A0A5N6UKP3_ASPTM|nr:hypothetical protein BDV40DRAFT_275340 [Aspergillus tamarii]